MGRVAGQPLGSRSRAAIKLISSAFSSLAGKWVWVVSVLGLWEREGKGRCRGKISSSPAARLGEEAQCYSKQHCFVFFL